MDKDENEAMTNPADQRHQQATAAVLKWYKANHRTLPWRANEGELCDPYHAWLSEVMLQQTTVATVKPYFTAFIARWPTLKALAQAPRDEVMQAWSGLGYYARARNLHACAEVVMREHGGIFPDSEQELARLPGIGAYTAAAIAAIAFGRRAVVVDANIERIAARWDAISQPLPSSKPLIYKTVDALTPMKRAGDFAQALMDIGALICTSAPPNCDCCPLWQTCRGRLGDPALLPIKKPKQPRPDRLGTALVIEDGDGNILFERRRDGGMLGGMLVLPGSDWADGSPAQRDYPLEGNLAEFVDACGGELLNSEVVHIFTHFRVILKVIRLKLSVCSSSKLETQFGTQFEDLRSAWVPVPKEKLVQAALPTVMRKVARLAGLKA